MALGADTQTHTHTDVRTKVISRNQAFIGYARSPAAGLSRINAFIGYARSPAAGLSQPVLLPFMVVLFTLYSSAQYASYIWWPCKHFTVEFFEKYSHSNCKPDGPDLI